MTVNLDDWKGREMAKNTICLWYDKDAEAAARFYAETFPESSVGAVHRARATIRPAGPAMSSPLRSPSWAFVHRP